MNSRRREHFDNWSNGNFHIRTKFNIFSFCVGAGFVFINESDVQRRKKTCLAFIFAQVVWNWIVFHRSSKSCHLILKYLLSFIVLLYFIIYSVFNNDILSLYSAEVQRPATLSFQSICSFSELNVK